MQLWHASRSDYDRGEERGEERGKAVSPKHTLNLSFCVWQQGLMRQREWFSGREGRGDHPRAAEEREGRALPIVVTFQREEEEEDEEEEGEDYLSSLVQEL